MWPNACHNGRKSAGGFVAVSRNIVANDVPPDFLSAHKDVLANPAIQFKLAPPPVVPKPLPTPEWLLALDRMIAAFARMFGNIGAVFFWGAVVIAVLAFVYFVLRELGYIRFKPKAAAPDAVDEAEWTMDAAAARKLLAEAEALAAQGAYEEAAHLLLLRSFEDIERRRPGLLKPANTAREMIETPALPARARLTFAEIARQVEASLFGGGRLDAMGWERCRTAYGRFAMPQEWQ